MSEAMNAELEESKALQQEFHDALAAVFNESDAQRIRAFDSEHGGDPAIIGPWYVYEDGARRHIVDGELIDPPANEHFKQFLRWRYYADRFYIAQEKLIAFLQRSRDGKLDSLSSEEVKATIQLLEDDMELRRSLLRTFEKANSELWERFAVKYQAEKRYPNLIRPLKATTSHPQESAA